jgi:hypothetical protein
VTYRSHPVRRLCADPHPTESITLVVEIDPNGIDRETLDSVLADLDGAVEAELPYDSYRITLPETAVESFCETSGLERVETTNVTGLGDAGEDV